jgi:predicted metalloprotease with PDZ domain
MTIRQLSKGKRSLDDFARNFFGIRDGDWGVQTYTFDTVVAELNKVQPYDWAKFLDERMRQPGQPAPLAGIEKGGYRLVWKEEPNVFDKKRMKEGSNFDLTHSLGLVIDKEAKVSSVLWDSPAFTSGIVNGAKLIAVNGVGYSKDVLTDAIKAAKAGTGSTRLIVQRGDRFDILDVKYAGGMRYPHLERVGAGVTLIDQLLLAKRKP